MNRPAAPARAMHGLAVAVVVSALVSGAVPAARGDAEPGPVPLVRDAVPATPDAADPRPVAPAGLGDWRLLAALGATFAVLMGARLVAVRRTPPPPPDVFEVLGTASLGGQHAVRIVRFGPKTLLVGVSSAGATTLAEIGDAQSTACIAAACRGVQRPREPARPATPAVVPVRSGAAKEVA